MAIEMKPAQDEDEDDGVALTPKRMAEIREKVAKKVAAERAREAEVAFEQKLLAEERAKLNALTGDPEEDRIIFFTPRVSASGLGKTLSGEELDGPKINGKIYRHGVTYEVPVHLARTLQDICYRTEVSEQMREDKPMTEFYREQRREMRQTVVTRRGVHEEARAAR